MQTVSTDELNLNPQRLVHDARSGKAAIVTQDGEPVLLTVPLGRGIESTAVRIELAAAMFDREQISLGLAARIAGLTYDEMVDELGRRGVEVIRLGPGELERQLAAFDGH